jgi:hypothetical protein
MQDVTVLRLYVLRGLYLFIVVGLGLTLWPDILAAGKRWSVADGEISCMLAAFSLLCVLGLRYPLGMLPVLLWEVTWKTLWLLLVPFPQWMSGHVDESLGPTIFAVSLVILVYLAIPWPYVFTRYVTAPGDRWRQSSAFSLPPRAP